MNGNILLVCVEARGTPRPNAFICENPGGGKRQRGVELSIIFDC